jgi:hypothetical protein
MIPFLSPSELKVETGPDDEQVGSGNQAGHVVLQIEAMRGVCTSVPVYEMKLSFYVPELCEVEAGGDRLIEDMAGRSFF